MTTFMVKPTNMIYYTKVYAAYDIPMTAYDQPTHVQLACRYDKNITKCFL